MASYKEVRPQSEFDSRIIPSFASADARYFGFVILLRIWLTQLNPPKGQNRFTTRNAPGDRVLRAHPQPIAHRHLNFRASFLVGPTRLAPRSSGPRVAPRPSVPRSAGAPPCRAPAPPRRGRSE